MAPMDFKRLLIRGVVYSTLGLGPLFAAPQREAGQTTSLGDFARDQRRKQDKELQKPTKVYTNENLPAHPPDEQRTPTDAAPSTTAKDRLISSANFSSTALAELHDENHY